MEERDMKSLLIGFVLFFAAGNSQAGTFWPTELVPNEARVESLPPGLSAQFMLNIANDRDSNLSKLSVAFDKNHLLAGLYTEKVERSFFTVLESETKYFPLRDIEDKEGAVLFESQGRKVLILQGQLNRSSQEGKFRINYLANGLSMRYESCDFNLRKKDDTWLVTNAATGKKVNEIKIITWSLGVTTLQGICPEKTN